MLSDEEKKEKMEMNRLYGFTIHLNKEQVKIIENLFKEIEADKEKIEELEKQNEEIQEQYYISKAKIKTIIEELQEDIKYSANPLSIDNSKFGIKVLQSLLEEEE